MEIEKDIVLDRICSRIADHRATINEATTAEGQDKAKALARMQDTKVEMYKAHGIELVHTHTDKLRVRLIDDDESAKQEAPIVPGDDTGAGDVLDSENA